MVKTDYSILSIWSIVLSLFFLLYPSTTILSEKIVQWMLSIIMPITISIKHSYRLLKRCFNILVRTILSVFNKQQHLIMLWMWLISILSSEMLYINLEYMWSWMRLSESCCLIRRCMNGTFIIYFCFILKYILFS